MDDSSQCAIIVLQQNVAVVHVRGDVDIANLHQFRECIERAEAMPISAVVVTLDGAGCLCARIYGILTSLHERMNSEGRRLYVVCHGSHQPRRIMALLDVPFPVFKTLERALAAETRWLEVYSGNTALTHVP